MRSLIAILAISSLLFSCGSRNAEENTTAKIEPWSLEFNSLRKTEADCTGDTCTYIELSIPVLSGGSVDARSRINDYVDATFREALKSRLPEPNSTAPFPDLAESFLEGYKLFNMEFPESDVAWFLELKGDSSILADAYFTAIITDSDFMGGAHPNSYTTIQSFDLEDGRSIDILSRYDSASVYQIAEAEFRAIHQIPDTVGLNDAGMMFENGKFALPENMGLTPNGLMLYYNSYEVASYATGPTRIQIPYSRLQSVNQDLANH
jgi:hypothetical protein